MLGSTVVDWHALEQVVLYSIVAGVGVPAVYALAVLGAARSTDAARERRNAVATAYGLLSLLGGVLCLAAIAFGVYVMSRK